LWVRYQVRPEDVVERLRERTNPVCYVLEGRSFADLAVLQSACVRLKLARPPQTPARRGARAALRFFT